MATKLDSIIRDNNLTRDQIIYFKEYVHQRDLYEMWMDDCGDDESLAIRMADRASTIAFELDQLASEIWGLNLRELYKPLQHVL